MSLEPSHAPREGEENTTESSAIVVFVTASSAEEAQKIARGAVESGLAACANILPPIRSIFVWEHKITEETELLIVFKTKRRLFSDLANEVKRLHSYEVPEIVALPIVTGTEDYLNWLRISTRN